MSAPPVSSVYNLTDSPLTSDETMLLEKGMKFIPTNPKWDHAQWCTDIGNFTKKIKSKWIYEGQTKAKNKTKLEYEKLKRPHQTTWQPPLSQLTTPQQDFIKELSRALTNLKPLNQRDNLKTPTMTEIRPHHPRDPLWWFTSNLLVPRHMGYLLWR